MKKRFLINIGMILMLLPLYNTKLCPLLFHEILGIAIFTLFVIHIWVNRKWKAKPMERTVTIALGIAFLCALVSGIMISHELFPRAEKAAHIWRTLHLGSSLVALLLGIVHGVQHRKSLLAIFRKRKWVQVSFAVVALALCAFFAVRTGMLMGGYHGGAPKAESGMHQVHAPKSGERK